MRKNSLNTIIRFSLSKQTFFERALYLVRGLVFAPWLLGGVSGQATRDQTAAAIGQAGDDIYPLF